MPRTLTALFITSLALVGCTATDDAPNIDDPIEDPTDDPMDESIIGTADAAGEFSTLLAAIDAAGLTATLQGEGSFTVFAPTDDAFAALPAGTVDGLLADVPALTEVLLYHVVSGEVPSSEVVGESLVTTLQGSDFKVTVDGGVFLNGIEVTTTDIEASNGVIHVIDGVLLPPPSITDIAIADGRFDTLVAALGAADLATTLSGEGPYTVFAPTDDAFDALPEGTVESLLANIPALTDILLYHVTDQRLPAADVVGASAVSTLLGQDIVVTIDAGAVMLDGSMVIATDIPAANGVIHVIDTVLLPE